MCLNTTLCPHLYPMFADVVMRLLGSRILALVFSLSSLSPAPAHNNNNNKESQLFKRGMRSRKLYHMFEYWQEVLSSVTRELLPSAFNFIRPWLIAGFFMILSTDMYYPCSSNLPFVLTYLDLGCGCGAPHPGHLGKIIS